MHSVGHEIIQIMMSENLPHLRNILDEVFVLYIRKTESNSCFIIHLPL